MESEPSKPVPTDTAPTPTQPPPDISSPRAYVKKHAANTATDYETWGEAEAARCLAGGELAHTSGATGAAVVEKPTAGMVRRLTPTECERLQGLPDGWTIPPSSA
jgi:site-specific DNA-cytosine methylase